MARWWWQPFALAPPTEARKLVEEAVAYARDLGFQPHEDYPRAMILFGDINSADSDATFVFGKDGKPFYASGPYDSAERWRQVISILHNRCGEGGYDYMVMVGGPGHHFEDFDDEDMALDFADEER
jgi:hypothetical protein